MDRAGPNRPPRRRLLPGLIAVGLAFVIAIALSVGGLPGSRDPQAATTWLASSLEWNNGLVLCIFDTTSPSVAVSALDLQGSGLSSSISEVSEVNATGATVAVASMGSASWILWNASTDDTFDQAYQAHVPLVAPSEPSTPLGSTDLRVDYLLPAYSESGSSGLNSVTAVFQVSNWTWQTSQDRLVLTLPLWPTFDRAEHLSAQTSNGSEITSWSNATGAAREYFWLSDSATAVTPNGLPMLLGVSSAVNLSPNFASVNVTLAPSPGNFTSITYTASVSIPLPSTVAGLPLYDYALVAAAAGALSIMVAVGTHRVRQRPSDLQYVEEES